MADDTDDTEVTEDTEYTDDTPRDYEVDTPRDCEVFSIQKRRYATYTTLGEHSLSVEWYRTSDSEAAKSDLEVDLVVEGTDEVYCVGNLHRHVLSQASPYFRARLLGSGWTPYAGRWRETLTRPEVLVAPRLLDSIYTQELPGKLDLPELLALFQLADRWGMCVASRACARAVADACADRSLPLQSLLRVRSCALFNTANFVTAAVSFKAALAKRFARVGKVVTSADRRSDLGILSADALDDLLDGLQKFVTNAIHPNDAVVLMTIWSLANEDLDATRLRDIFRRSAAGNMRWLSAGYLVHILARQRWRPPESELLDAVRLARCWRGRAPALLAGVTFQVRPATMTALREEFEREEVEREEVNEDEPEYFYTDTQYFAGYWWVLRLQVDVTVVRATVCLDTPQRLPEGFEYAQLVDVGVQVAAVCDSQYIWGVALHKDYDGDLPMQRCSRAVVGDQATTLLSIEIKFLELR
jgi:hypothetical protein